MSFQDKRNYDDPVYKNWRVSIFKRDKFRCQFPDCKCRTRLNAHHIIRWADAPFLRYEIDNGITLCKTHHDMIKDSENCYMQMFNDIIKNKKKKK